MSKLSLVCLDFDGTIVVYDEEPGFLHPAAVETINALAERGIGWCTNSGRGPDSQLRILELSRLRGLSHMPDALLCSESLIFRRRDGTYVPCEPWNTLAQIRLTSFHRKVQAAVRPHLDDWKQKYEPETYVGEGYTTFNVVDADGRTERLLAELKEAVRDVEHAMVTRNGGWLVLLPDDLGKGNVLRGYQKVAGIAHEATLAVGDHFNDISMLDGSAARHVGCPANAIADVVRTVVGAGGYVARGQGAEGTVEIIQHYLSALSDA